MEELPESLQDLAMLGWSFSSWKRQHVNFSDCVCVCVKSINRKLGAVHTSVIPATQVADEGGSSILGFWGHLGNIDSS